MLFESPTSVDQNPSLSSSPADIPLSPNEQKQVEEHGWNPNDARVLSLLTTAEILELLGSSSTTPHLAPAHQ